MHYGLLYLEVEMFYAYDDFLKNTAMQDLPS